MSYSARYAEPNSPVIERMYCTHHHFLTEVPLIKEVPDTLPAGPFCDVACGTGNGTRMLAASNPTREIYGIDNNPEFIDIANSHKREPNLTYILGDANNLAEYGSFAFIESFSSMHHFELDQHLTSLTSALLPNGLLRIEDFARENMEIALTASGYSQRELEELYAIVKATDSVKAFEESPYRNNSFAMSVFSAFASYHFTDIQKSLKQLQFKSEIQPSLRARPFKRIFAMQQ